MADENICRCCTCGHSWIRGTDGFHSCAARLKIILEAVHRVAAGLDQVADDDTGGMEWIANHIETTLGDTP